jgi:hypothetical protein
VVRNALTEQPHSAQAQYPDKQQRILQRKRLWIADFADKAALAERLEAFIREWNQVAHPFKWMTKSVAKVMSKCKLTEVAQEGGQPMAA